MKIWKQKSPKSRITLIYSLFTVHKLVQQLHSYQDLWNQFYFFLEKSQLFNLALGTNQRNWNDIKLRKVFQIFSQSKPFNLTGPWSKPTQLCWDSDHHWTWVFRHCPTQGDLIKYNFSKKHTVYNFQVWSRLNIWFLRLSAQTCTRSRTGCLRAKKKKNEQLSSW